MASKKLPSYRLAKSTGRAYVQLNGRRIYLGKHGTPESEERYRATLAEWLARGQCAVPPQDGSITVCELCDLYREHAEKYYVLPSGKPSSMLFWVDSIIETLLELYAALPAVQFGPLALSACRQTWVDRGLSRGVCNKYTSQARRIFKWAVSQELLPPSVHQALAALEGLRKGHTEAREPEPVSVVPDADIAAVRAVLPPSLAALVDLQLLTAARPGELLRLRPCDIDTSGAVWVTRPEDHKTAHRGKERVIAFGPQAQALLRPWLLRPEGAYLFSPREVVARRAAPKDKRRREDQKPNAVQTARKVGECYTPDSYRNAIKRACEKVNAERAEAEKMEGWHPHQLRHTALTRIRAGFGLEAAQVVAGHEHAAVTEIYAERDMALLVKVMGEVG